MADKDLGDGDGPSLEMPSLGSLFKRKKKAAEKDDAPTVSREELDAVVRGKKPAQEVEPEAAEPAAEPAPDATAGAAVSGRAGGRATESDAGASETSAADDPADSTDATSTTTSEAGTDDVPTTVIPAGDATTSEAGRDDVPTDVVPTGDAASDTEHTVRLPEVEPTEPAGAESTGPAGAEAAGAEAGPAAAADARARRAEVVPTQDEPVAVEPSAAEPPSSELDTDDETDRPLFADGVQGDRAPDATTVLPVASPDGDVTAKAEETDPVDAELEDDDVDEEDERTPRTRRGLTLPPLPGRAAAAVTGLVVGLLAVAMTYLAVQGCEKVKGTSSCGTPGFFLLVAIMILLVVLGSSLLNAWRQADPGSTSFMAVGLVAVVALLFLIRVIFSPWMIVVIPLVAVVAFVVSHWLTSLFVEEDSADAHA
ncbi:hypothetical protein ASG90_09540 [Nocardioides sp. Soil797]|nr:hypothetical protein ASG90_09540 [Nocardioides sp. Soil797]